MLNETKHTKKNDSKKVGILCGLGWAIVTGYCVLVIFVVLGETDFGILQCICNMINKDRIY